MTKANTRAIDDRPHDRSGELMDRGVFSPNRSKEYTAHVPIYSVRELDHLNGTNGAPCQ